MKSLYHQRFLRKSFLFFIFFSVISLSSVPISLYASNLIAEDEMYLDSLLPLHAFTLSAKDYFDIARAIAHKPRGRELVLKNIMRDHTGKNPDKSFFNCDTEQEINSLIDEIVNSPSYYDFSKSTGRLMIIKDFDREDFIGIHKTPNGQLIESNRITLFFGIEGVVSKGKPWDGKAGVLLTGFPDNPSRNYP